MDAEFDPTDANTAMEAYERMTAAEAEVAELKAQAVAYGEERHVLGFRFFKVQEEALALALEVRESLIALETFATRVINYRPLTSPELGLLPLFLVRLKHPSGQIENLETKYPQSLMGEIMGITALPRPASFWTRKAEAMGKAVEAARKSEQPTRLMRETLAALDSMENK